MSSDVPEAAQALIRRYLSEDEERAWLDLLAIHATVVRTIDSRLVDQHRLPMRAFDVLMRVAHGGPEPISISTLATQVAISPSQVSRVVMDLERRGLVRRERSPGDQRSTCASITDEGLALMAQAAPTYLSTLREQFFDALSQDDVSHLLTAWDNVLEH